MLRLNSANQEDERRRSRIGSQLPEEFYDYLDKQDLIRKDRFLKRFGKRLLAALRQPLLRRNRSNLTLLDSDTDSNFALIVTPKRAISLLSQRALLSRKSNPNREISYMKDSELTNGLLEERAEKGDDILLHGEGMAIIKLEKENGELGLNIVGGIDQEYIPGDPSIFISKIQNGGSAWRDRRLRIGDRIISVNGELLAGKTHDEVVQIFHNTKSSAVLMIEQDAESRVLNRPTELSGVVNSDELSGGVNSDENTSLSRSDNRSLFPKHLVSMSSKPANTFVPRIMSESTKVEKKNALSPVNDVVYLASSSTNGNYVDDKRMKKNKAESRNEINSVDHEGMLEMSVTTASPFTPLKDETAKSIDERSEGPVSLNSGDNHGDDDYDYEDENSLTASDHSSSTIDDIPVTPKKSYRLLDPSNTSVFNEVLAVSAGIAALGVGIYVVYHFIKHRSAP
ncbi:unnamed protein product [Cercopithifilaria johnstoni]|uniref:PDZ domain-containing protein n=1 Tax=Cercopithifilaria johnstoni TaxID=2874296 RepID=A0A8J2M569_9BILA|nr:unnamed protein product [Cercopithifilaria johnstoni]